MRFLLSLGLLILTLPCEAQTTGRIEGRQASPDGYYVNTLPGEPTTRVRVVGLVVRPGLYELGRGFDLATLVALAGGPSVNLQDPREPVVRVRYYRSGEAGRVLLYDQPYEDFLAGAGAVPDLRDDDVIEIAATFSLGVFVWGAVRTPGYFEVGPSVSAARLLALAGGPQGSGARSEDIATEATITLLRRGEGEVYKAPLEEFVAGVGVPNLVDGDVMQVDVINRSRFTFRDALGIAGSVAAVAVVVIRVVDLLGN